MMMDADLPRDARAALDRLRAGLAETGYAPFEVDAVVAGAKERAEMALSAEPRLETADLVALIDRFADPGLTPEIGESAGANTTGALGVGIGLAAIAAIMLTPFFEGEETGGAVLILAALLGGPAAILLGRKARGTAMGQAAILLGALVIAVPTLLIALLLLQVL